MLPKRIKKKRMLQGEDGTNAGWEVLCEWQE